MPNPNTLPYLRYQDIQIPDVQLRTQFQQFFQTGNYAEAISILSDNAAQLQGKAFIANTINTITSALLTIEKYYYQGVPVYLSNLASQYQVMINNLKKRGSWLSTTQYSPYNFVNYNGDIYMCIAQPPIGTLPTNTNYWLFLGLKGADGKPGVNVTMEYDWESTTNYQLNDLVVYNDNIYVALKDNTGITPGSDSTTWLIFIQFDKGQIYVGPNEPNSLNDNTVWFKTESDPSVATTSNPIIGEFQRYYADSSTWDEMYPNTIFNWVDGYSDYAQSIYNVQITILPSDWQNNQWSYVYDNLTEQSIVDILPGGSLNNTQTNLYDSLSINISDNLIELTSSITPNIELPILIKIIT